MDALVVFSSENNHPLQFLLSKKRRHVFCAICDDERGHWLSYDWHQGIPIIRCEAGSNFDLKAFYQEQGYEVVETTVGTTPPHGPLQWNNCVGHVKTILALNTYALVPNGRGGRFSERCLSSPDLVGRGQPLLCLHLLPSLTLPLSQTWQRQRKRI